MDNCLSLNDPILFRFRARVNWDLFWSKVELGEHEYSCMIWLASKDSSGYGTFSVSNRTLSAHRLGFLYYNSTLPLKGYELHHECSVRSCVNSSHLVVVPHSVNMELSRTTLDRESSDHSRFKNVCKNGHFMTEINTYIDRRGWTECRSCRQDNVRRWRQSRKGVMS